MPSLNGKTRKVLSDQPFLSGRAKKVDVPWKECDQPNRTGTKAEGTRNGHSGRFT